MVSFRPLFHYYCSTGSIIRLKYRIIKMGILIKMKVFFHIDFVLKKIIISHNYLNILTLQTGPLCITINLHGNLLFSTFLHISTFSKAKINFFLFFFYLLEKHQEKLKIQLKSFENSDYPFLERLLL